MQSSRIPHHPAPNRPGLRTTLISLPRSVRRLAILSLLLGTVVLGSLAVRHGSEAAVPVAAIQVESKDGIAQLRMQLQRTPRNPALQAQLGLSLLAQVRTSGDPLLYLQAEEALNRALVVAPDQLDALIGQGVLALARHDFDGALLWAERAEVLNPYRAQIKGIQVDGLVELGRYAEAAAAAQAMVDLRPDLHSYTRVSYVRELYGDVDGAIEAMTAAVEAGTQGSEPALWSLAQLGDLHLGQGDLAAAREAYTAALAWAPDYPYALAGLARIQAAEGRSDDAISAYEALVEQLPLPTFVTMLGDLYAAAGRNEEAQTQFQLVLAMEALNAEAGMDIELELARFTLNHAGDDTALLATALEQAEAVYSHRPTIYAADTLAWALYRTGDYDRAWTLSQEALRLGTRDAMLHHHAGIIARARGDQVNAKAHLDKATAINAYYAVSVR